jgi:hypothetical protein
MWNASVKRRLGLAGLGGEAVVVLCFLFGAGGRGASLGPKTWVAGSEAVEWEGDRSEVRRREQAARIGMFGLNCMETLRERRKVSG